jgi:hypothetical protein
VAAEQMWQVRVTLTYGERLDIFGSQGTFEFAEDVQEDIRNKKGEKFGGDWLKTTNGLSIPRNDVESTDVVPCP